LLDDLSAGPNAFCAFTKADAIFPIVTGSILVSWLVEKCHQADGGKCDNDKRYPNFLEGGQPVFAAIWAFDGVGWF
jgi:hypothetical protein